MTVRLLIALASFSLSFTASVFILILLILFAIGFAIYVYRHTVPEVSRTKRIQLITFRSIALALLLFLIFEPVLNLERTKTTQPHIAVLLDDSRSMTVQDAAGSRSDAMKKLITSSDFSSVAKKGEASYILFTNQTHYLKSLAPDSLRFRGGETDISGALHDVKKEFEEKNLQAVVLLSDGSYTAGQNPLYAAETMGVPVYVVGIGDSTEKKDILIQKVMANDIAYVESKVPIEVTLQSAGFQNETVDVTLKEGVTIIEKKSVQLHDGVNEYPVSFTFEPKTEGVRRLTVHVRTLQGELTDKNNTKTFFMKVLKNKMKLVLVAGAPSPDVSLFQRVLRSDKNVEVQSYVQKIGNTWYGMPPEQKTFMEADGIFFLGYPIRQSDQTVLGYVKNALDKLNKPLFILFSRTLDVQKLKASLDAYLPFDIIQSREEEMQAFFELSPTAHANPVISTGLLREAWQNLPPLFKTESSFKPRVGTEILGVMKMNNITFDEPMLISRKLNRSKMIVSFGYGLWQWEFAKDVHAPSVANTLISNAIRWLTTREEDKFVRIKPMKEFFDNGERVEFTGQAYNQSYEPMDDATVAVRITGPNGEQDLLLQSIGAGRYQGALDGAQEGDYQYAGTATESSALIGKDNGRFSVGELNIEFQDTKMNNILLRQIANRSGGKYYSPNQISSLASDISSRKDFATKDAVIKSDINLWNLVWLLAGAIVFFALEWYFRKQAGMI